MTPEVVTDPFVPVAFGLELGERARRENLTYDVDYELLIEALRAGGMNEADIASCPIVIRGSNNIAVRGRAFSQSPDQIRDRIYGRTSYIELYTVDGKSPISAQTATHEARHVADRLHGYKVIVSERARLVRKIAVTAGVLALGVGYYHFVLGGDFSATPYTVDAGSFTACITDIFLSNALIAEFASRKHERRARRAAKKIGKESLLKINNMPVDTHAPFGNIVWSQARQIVVPNYNL